MGNNKLLLKRCNQLFVSKMNTLSIEIKKFVQHKIKDVRR